MPLYEYECEACGKRVEKIQKFSDPPLEVCPSCGGKVKKLFSSPAIQFKGSGWYITDYAKKSSTEASKAGGTKTDTGSDTKADTSAGGNSGSSSDAKSDARSKSDSKKD